MLVLLKRGVSETAASDIATRLRMFGLSVHRTDTAGRCASARSGEGGGVDWEQVRGWEGVESANKIPVPFKL